MIAALPGIVSLEQARRLKAHGFPQSSPSRQFVYLPHYPEGFVEQPAFGRWDDSMGDRWIAAPFLLSDDPERPGAVEWFESLDWEISSGRRGWAVASTAVQSLPIIILTAPRLSALIDQILDVMEEKAQ